MALQINKEFTNGVKASKCYIKITNVRYSKISEISEEYNGAELTISFYFDKEARDSNSANHLEQKPYMLSDFSNETRESQYEHLKTLDEFKDAIDI